LVFEVTAFLLEVSGPFFEVATLNSEVATPLSEVTTSKCRVVSYGSNLVSPPGRVESFAEVLPAAKDALKLTNADVAARMRVSKGAIEYWLQHAPPPHRRQSIVDAFPDLPAELRRRLAASLGIVVAVAEERPPAPDPAMIKAALEAALFEAAETMNAPARDVRKAFAALLARVAALGVDAGTASAIVGGKREGGS
jgi:hypothetical protein